MFWWIFDTVHVWKWIFIFLSKFLFCFTLSYLFMPFMSTDITFLHMVIHNRTKTNSKVINKESYLNLNDLICYTFDQVILTGWGFAKKWLNRKKWIVQWFKIGWLVNRLADFDTILNWIKQYQKFDWLVLWMNMVQELIDTDKDNEQTSRSKQMTIVQPVILTKECEFFFSIPLAHRNAIIHKL